MPRRGGAELGIHVRRRYPTLRVLYTSGYPHGSELIDEHGVPLPFLAKPYVPSTLLRRVRDVLDARRS
jgi:hypothetical protein